MADYLASSSVCSWKKGKAAALFSSYWEYCLEAGLGGVLPQRSIHALEALCGAFPTQTDRFLFQLVMSATSRLNCSQTSLLWICDQFLKPLDC